MSNVVKIENTAVAAMSEQEMMTVLQNSLYPGAKPESIKLVLGYCKAAGLDPMQKPVHIVPISVKQGDNYVMRDTVMAGIGLYRTQASRTGEYAGITEPEYGPTKQLKVGDFMLEYPEWCRVTVKRRSGGSIVEFTANERWLENYATAKRDSQIPNAMWKRRPFAQLAKCAEAQALRKAFPELGAAPTADETIVPAEDEFHGTTIDGATGAVVSMPQAKSRQESVAPPAKIEETKGAPSEPAGTADAGPRLSATQQKILKNRMAGAALTEADFSKKFGVELAGFPAARFNEVTDWLSDPQ